MNNNEFDLQVLQDNESIEEIVNVNDIEKRSGSNKVDHVVRKFACKISGKCDYRIVINF